MTNAIPFKFVIFKTHFENIAQLKCTPTDINVSEIGSKRAFIFGYIQHLS